ncbi:MAG TPA: hypothetical protein DCX00_02120 [Flavobacteriales bacterium]|nr:hypothetical protein [Flavobacteriales bacterium]
MSKGNMTFYNWSWLLYFCVFISSGCTGLGGAMKVNTARSSVHSFLRDDGSLMFFTRGIELVDSKNNHLLLDVTLHTSDSLCNQARVMASLWTPSESGFVELSLLNSAQEEMMDGTRLHSTPSGRGQTEHRYSFTVPSEWIVEWMDEEEPSMMGYGRSWDITKQGTKSLLSAQAFVLPEWRVRCTVQGASGE